MKILGIESSCDETSIAVLNDGAIVANEIYSQDIHGAYGGVVPEIASRAHLQKIDALCAAVFEKHALHMKDIDGIAVTDCPGLAGALLVGISFALGLHAAYRIPVSGINHLEGHICSIFLEHPDISFPFLALAVSGGHTSIYKVSDFGVYECLGQTIDDAAGEAFDKIGKMLGFAYPAGYAIELEAQKTNEALIPFPIARVRNNSRLDFSFSGLKTAVKYFCKDKTDESIRNMRPLICKSFQQAVIDALIGNVCLASEASGISTVALVGGVACNTELRTRLKDAMGPNVYFPRPNLCTDNAAMIAMAGYEHWKRSTLRYPRMTPSAGL
jgi:N6-L-threonylcarbamoyladenine synthase